MASSKPLAPWAERLRHRVIRTPAHILVLLLATIIATYVFVFGWLYAMFHMVVPSLLSDEAAGFWDCIYFSLITAATIGYGDLVPTQAGRVLAGVEAFGALALLSVMLGVVLTKVLVLASPFVFDDHAVLQVPVNPGADDPELLPRFAFRCMNVGPEDVHDVTVWISYRRQLKRPLTKDFGGFRVQSCTEHTIIWSKRVRQHFRGYLCSLPGKTPENSLPARADGVVLKGLPRGIRRKDSLRVYVSAFNPVLQQRVAGYREYKLSDWETDCGRFASIRTTKGNRKVANWRNWGDYDIAPFALCQQCEYADGCFFRERHGLPAAEGQMSAVPVSSSEDGAPRDTIVMIHGMWCGPWVWQNYKGYFERLGYRCLTPPLRYHHDVSPSEKPSPRLGKASILDYARDLERLILSLPEPPILVGHSMGGLLAQILASRKLAKAAVLLTPASPFGICALRWSVLKSFRGMILDSLRGRPIRPDCEDRARYAMLDRVPEHERHRILRQLVWESGQAAAEIGFWPLNLRRRASRVVARDVQCPMLVVAGAEDNITPASVVRRVADRYRHVATYKEFPDHAHWVLGEPGWKHVAQYVAEWLHQLPD